MAQTITFPLEGEFVALNDLLKLAGICDSGGAGKALVASGEAPFGIVYATDALAEPKVKALGAFPAGTHDPILYPAALTKSATPEAAAFLAFLKGDTAGAIFAKAGFGKPAG